MTSLDNQHYFINRSMSSAMRNNLDFLPSKYIPKHQSNDTSDCFSATIVTENCDVLVQRFSFEVSQAPTEADVEILLNYMSKGQNIARQLSVASLTNCTENVAPSSDNYSHTLPSVSSLCANKSKDLGKSNQMNEEQIESPGSDEAANLSQRNGVTTVLRVMNQSARLSTLSHENVATFNSLILTPRELYFVQDSPGTRLDALIGLGYISAEHARLFTYQMLRALKYMHSAGIPHPYLTPSDIFITCHNLMLKVACYVKDASTHDWSIQCSYSAPEQLMNSNSCTADHGPSTAADLWAVGCILAEMLLNSCPLFKSTSHMDQLLSITQYVHLSELDWTQLMRVMPNKLLKNHPLRPRTPLCAILAGNDVTALQLVEQLLTFSPRDRPTVEQALKHDYLQIYHCPDDEPIAALLNVSRTLPVNIMYNDASRSTESINCVECQADGDGPGDVIGLAGPREIAPAKDEVYTGDNSNTNISVRKSISLMYEEDTISSDIVRQDPISSNIDSNFPEFTHVVGISEPSFTQSIETIELSSREMDADISVLSNSAVDSIGKHAGDCSRPDSGRDQIRQDKDRKVSSNKAPSLVKAVPANRVKIMGSCKTVAAAGKGNLSSRSPISLPRTASGPLKAPVRGNRNTDAPKTIVKGVKNTSEPNVSKTVVKGLSTTNDSKVKGATKQLDDCNITKSTIERIKIAESKTEVYASRNIKGSNGANIIDDIVERNPSKLQSDNGIGNPEIKKSYKDEGSAQNAEDERRRKNVARKNMKNKRESEEGKAEDNGDRTPSSNIIDLLNCSTDSLTSEGRRTPKTEKPVHLDRSQVWKLRHERSSESEKDVAELSEEKRLEDAEVGNTTPPPGVKVISLGQHVLCSKHLLKDVNYVKESEHVSLSMLSYDTCPLLKRRLGPGIFESPEKEDSVPETQHDSKTKSILVIPKISLPPQDSNNDRNDADGDSNKIKWMSKDENSEKSSVNIMDTRQMDARSGGLTERERNRESGDGDLISTRWGSRKLILDKIESEKGRSGGGHQNSRRERRRGAHLSRCIDIELTSEDFDDLYRLPTDHLKKEKERGRGSAQRGRAHNRSGGGIQYPPDLQRNQSQPNEHRMWHDYEAAAYATFDLSSPESRGSVANAPQVPRKSSGTVQTSSGGRSQSHDAWMCTDGRDSPTSPTRFSRTLPIETLEGFGHSINNLHLSEGACGGLEIDEPSIISFSPPPPLYRPSIELDLHPFVSRKPVDPASSLGSLHLDGLDCNSLSIHQMRWAGASLTSPPQRGGTRGGLVAMGRESPSSPESPASPRSVSTYGARPKKSPRKHKAV